MNMHDVIAALKNGLEEIVSAWEENETSDEDDEFDDGYEAGLADAKEIARDALRAARENGLA